MTRHAEGGSPPGNQREPITGGDSDEILYSAQLQRAFNADLRLRRRAEAGTLHRIGRGQYIDARRWLELDDDRRYSLRVRGAATLRRTELVLSHQSAAVIWGLPSRVRWPDEVHFTTERTRGGRSKPGIVKHAIGLDARSITRKDGLLVTTVARTVIDLATTLDLRGALAAADHALAIDPRNRVPPLITRAELLEEWERMLPFRGSVRARAVIDFATSLSGSVNETDSRVTIALIGFPEPILQQRFIVDDREFFTDFFWLAQSGVGEADGRSKYFDELLRGGRSPEQVVYDEKLREDGIRRQVNGFARWDSTTGRSQSRLRARLLPLGLPIGPPRLLAR